MKKCVKVGNRSFLCLGDRTLYIDRESGSAPFEFISDVHDRVQGKILDFSFDEPSRELRVVTSDGDAVSMELEGDDTTKIASFEKPFVAASIHNDLILAIEDKTYVAMLLNFEGMLVREIDIEKPRFCLLTGQIIALADSSMSYISKFSLDPRDWKQHKFRDYFVLGILDVNRQTEFGVVTTKNTRIVRSRYHTIFRNWATETVCLLQCPRSKHFYAHLGRDGTLRIGDNEADYSLQEEGCTGICWDLGVLWSRSADGAWHRLVLAFRDELYDLRATRLSGMEATLTIEDAGQVLDIIEAMIERPALSKEILRVLPAIAQNLTSGVYVSDAKRSLDCYIRKSEPIHELIGQIDMVIDASVT